MTTVYQWQGRRSVRPWTGLLLLLLLFAGGCSREPGRVAVILDNSGSMEQAGISFAAIKQELLNTLRVLPPDQEVGLRVFSAVLGSSLVAPYGSDLETLRSKLAGIQPGGGTNIGGSLLDAAADIRQSRLPGRHLFLVTDGEGDPGDVDAARAVRDEILAGLPYQCRFIVFSTRSDVRDATPIGRTADAMGCDFDVVGRSMTGEALAGALYRAFGSTFFPFWILVSAVLFGVLALLSAQLVFAIQVARRARARLAWVGTLLFAIGALPLVVAVHGVGLLGLVGEPVLWWGAGFVAATVLLMAVASTRRTPGNENKTTKGGSADDPFA